MQGQGATAAAKSDAYEKTHRFASECSVLGLRLEHNRRGVRRDVGMDPFDTSLGLEPVQAFKVAVGDTQPHPVLHRETRFLR